MNRPLLFSLHEPIFGNGFCAGVALNGRALAKHDEDGDGSWWVYGVHPGPIAAHGSTMPEAFAAFVHAFREYVRRTAADAESFAAFKAEVERCFRQSDELTVAEWEKARASVRSSKAKTVDGSYDKVRSPPAPTIDVAQIKDPRQAAPADKPDSVGVAA